MFVEKRLEDNHQRIKRFTNVHKFSTNGPEPVLSIFNVSISHIIKDAAQLIKTSGIGTHFLAKKTPGPIKALTVYSKCLIRCKCFARSCGHHFFTNSSPCQGMIIAHQPLPWRWLVFFHLHQRDFPPLLLNIERRVCLRLGARRPLQNINWGYVDHDCENETTPTA